jgi:hypothetical protein
MTEQLLDNTDIRSMVEKVRRKTMTKYVRRHAIFETNLLCCMANDQPDTLTIQSTTPRGEKDRLSITAMLPLGGSHRGATARAIPTG